MTGPLELLENLRDPLASAHLTRLKLLELRRSQILEARGLGYELQAIADAAGMTRQRVGQILKGGGEPK